MMASSAMAHGKTPFFPRIDGTAVLTIHQIVVSLHVSVYHIPGERRRERGWYHHDFLGKAPKICFDWLVFCKGTQKKDVHLMRKL